jgi:pilus assembly protein Flp/PilA
MYNYVKTCFELKADKRAVTALEYGLIASVIAVGLIAVLPGVSTALNATFTAITAAL